MNVCALSVFVCLPESAAKKCNPTRQQSLLFPDLYRLHGASLKVGLLQL
jgi:hypothetical protein